MLVSEFDYELPEELIAQRPAPERTASRLLHLDARSGEIEDLAFAELPAQLGGGDTVVLNDTRVIKARLPGRKRTGGRIEVFIERALGANDALALVRASHAPPEGSELLAKLTLHVGVGTFQPVRSERVEDHRMHPERYTIPRETMDALRGRRVLAVGTTSLRALETAAQTGELSGETGLFVYPGFSYRVVDRLLTNFHLPRSTLLMLVSAFAGKDRIFRAYRHAVEKRYRFFSYGDAMLIER